LVSDARAQTTGTPIPLVLGLGAVITGIVGGKIAAEVGLDPLLGVSVAAGALAVLSIRLGLGRGDRSGF
jgi:hypothetical protein